MKRKIRKVKTRARLVVRSEVAQIAHFRGGAGAMGGGRRQQARRRRRRDRLDEQEAQKQDAVTDEG